jgi:hypothetical protein
MGVLAIWRYPVKAMLGELLDSVRVGLGGCDADRRWVVADRDTGERIANKRGPTDPRLRACRAELLDDGAAGEPPLRVTLPDREPPLRVTLPDGEAVAGREIEPALSELLGRRVRLEAADGPALGRFGATGAHHDLAPVHLIATSTLAYLRRMAPESDWDARRFRPNLLLDGGDAGGGFAEDALLGGRLRGSSGLTLTVGLPTPRCVVPTRAQPGLAADPGILRAAVERHRMDLGPAGRRGCVGAYAEVASAGHVRVGEWLAVDPPAVAIEAAIGSSMARVVERRRPQVHRSPQNPSECSG